MYCVFDIVCQTMAAIGATSQSSVILSASQPGSTEIFRCTSLGFDRNRNLYTRDGTVDELQEFCVGNLELLEPKLSSSERCISLKTKGVTFTLYPSTKTLQVQGMDQKEVKRKMQVFLPTDQGNQSENSELSTDVEDVISSIQGDNDESTIGSMKGVVWEVLDQDVPASPGVQHLSCKGCNALKLELQNVKLEVEELKRQMVFQMNPLLRLGSQAHRASLNMRKLFGFKRATIVSQILCKYLQICFLDSRVIQEKIIQVLRSLKKDELSPPSPPSRDCK